VERIRRIKKDKWNGIREADACRKKKKKERSRCFALGDAYKKLLLIEFE